MPPETSTLTIKQTADQESYSIFVRTNKRILTIYFFMEWIFIIPLSLFVYLAWGETDLEVVIVGAIALLIFFHIRKVRQIYSLFYKYFARLVYRVEIEDDKITLATKSSRFLWVYFPEVEMTIYRPEIEITDDFPNFRIVPIDKVYLVQTDHGPLYVHKNFFNDDIINWFREYTK